MLCGVISTFTSSSFSADAGAEGMQDAGHVCVFNGSDPWSLHHQSRVQLGGPSGPECLATAQQCESQPEPRTQLAGEDGTNNVYARWYKMRSAIKL